MPVVFHMLIHLDDCIRLRSETHIKQDCKLRSQLFAKSIEEPIVRRKFTSIFVFCAQKQVHNCLVCILVFYFFIQGLSIPIIPFVSRIIDQAFCFEIELYPVSEVSQIGKILFGRYVIITVLFGLLKSCCNQRFRFFYIVNIIDKIFFFQLLYILICQTSLFFSLPFCFLKEKSFDSTR